MNYIKIIRSIIPLVSFKESQNTRNISSSVFKKSDSYKVIEGIDKNRYESQEEILSDLYPNKKSAKSIFWDMANKTVSSLIGHLYLEPTERKKDYKSVYEECQKKACGVMLLRSKGAQEAAMEVAHQTIKKSIKYHVTETTKTLARELTLRYQVLGNERMSKKYKVIYEKYKSIHEAEEEAYFMLNEAAMLSDKSKKPGSALTNQIINLLDSIINIDVDVDVDEQPYNLTFRKLYARTLKANFLNDHNEILQVVSDFNDYSRVVAGAFNPPVGHMFAIRNKLSPHLIISKEYEAAKSNIATCLNTRYKGGQNWHMSLQFKSILGFHSGEYELSKSSVQLAKKNNIHASSSMKEWWIIVEAYLYFLSLLNKVEYNKQFRVSRFLNEFTLLSKDKSGANVSILIIGEFLIRLALGDRDSLIEKNEAIRLYKYNNLKEESTKRSDLFFNILRQVSKSNFRVGDFRKNTQSYFQELKNHPLTIEDLETEIIPFEYLYEMISTILSTQSSVDKLDEQTVRVNHI